MARLSRHQLKTDEFAERMAVISRALKQHRRTIVLGGGTAVVVLGVALGVFFYVRSRQARAADAFTAALASYHALVTATPPPNSTLPHFKTSEEKFKKALEQFTEVSVEFRRYRQGQWARYYAALCQRELGNVSEAEKGLSAVAREGDADLAAVAKMALASLYQQTSRTAESEKIYRELESHPTSLVPKPAVQIALAELYQRTNPSQATTLYQQIEKEYSGTAAGDQASKALRGPSN